MSYKITVKYVKPVQAEASIPTYPIAPEFILGTSYVDQEAFRKGIDDAAYPKNIWGMNAVGMAESIEQFLGEVSVHPGVVFACKSAIMSAQATAADAPTEDKGYEFEAADYEDKMLYEDAARALKDQGFEITVSPM